MGTILFLLFLGTLLSGIGLGLFKALGKKGYDTTFNLKPFAVYAITGLLLSFVPLTLFSSYVPVNQGYVGVIKRMGAVTGTLQPGPHFVTPFITSVDEVSIKTC